MYLINFLTAFRPAFLGNTDRNMYFVFIMGGKIATLSITAFYALLICFILGGAGSAIGSCSGGPFALIFISLPFIAAAGLILSIILWATGHRFAKGPTFVNGAVLAGYLLLLVAMGWLH
jgi:hypothetical protein